MSFISDFFALNGYIFVTLTNKKLLLSLKCRPNKNLFLGCVKLIGYLASAVNWVSSNLYVGPSPKIKISLFLLPMCTNELISARRTMVLFPVVPSVS